MTTKKTEPAEFDLAEILGAARPSTMSVDISLNDRQALRVFELQQAIAQEEENPVERDITDAGPKGELEELTEEIRRTGLTVELRALPAKIITKTEEQVAREYLQAKENRNIDEPQLAVAIQQRYEQLKMVVLLSNAITRVTYNANGVSKDGLSKKEVELLYNRLPQYSWEQLVEAYNVVSGTGMHLAANLAVASFRRHENSLAQERLVFAPLEGGEGE